MLVLLVLLVLLILLIMRLLLELVATEFPHWSKHIWVLSKRCVVEPSDLSGRHFTSDSRMGTGQVTNGQIE